MKKLLVSTTALVSIVASAAFADAPSNVEIKLNGLMQVEYGVRQQNKNYRQNLSTNQKNTNLNQQGRVSVSAIYKADAGYNYGAVLGLSPTGNAQTGKNSSTLDNTYLFVDSSIGRVEIGSNYSASKTMGISGSTVARGDGGANGNWDNYAAWNYTDLKNSDNDQDFNESNDINDKTEVVLPTSIKSSFYTGTGLLGDSFSGKNSSESSQKITYYTPVVSGFQAGISFTPDSDLTGDGQNYTKNVANVRTLKNQVNLGLKYTGNFDQITLAVSAIGVTGKVAKSAVGAPKHNLTGYAFGTSLSYAGFSVSGNYGSMNKRFFTYDTAAGTGKIGDTAVMKAPKFWSAGVAYVQGPFGVSTNYYSSTNSEKNKFAAVGVSADYQLAPGFSPYASYVNYNAKPSKTLYPNVTKNNKGNVYLVGATLAF